MNQLIQNYILGLSQDQSCIDWANLIANELYAVDRDGLTTLQNVMMTSCYEGKLYVLETLLSHGMSPNLYIDQGMSDTLLTMASRSSMPCVRLLLRHGADPSIQRNGGDTALHTLCRLDEHDGSVQSSEVVAALNEMLLLMKNANLTNDQDLTPVDILLRQTVSTGPVARMKELIENHLLQQ